MRFAPLSQTAVPAWHAGEDAQTSQLPLVPTPTTEQKPGKRRAGGRAGRNLPAAIGVGVGLVLVVLASLVIWPDAFLGVIVVASGVGGLLPSGALQPSGLDTVRSSRTVPGR